MWEMEELGRGLGSGSSGKQSKAKHAIVNAKHVTRALHDCLITCVQVMYTGEWKGHTSSPGVRVRWRTRTRFLCCSLCLISINVTRCPRLVSAYVHRGFFCSQHPASFCFWTQKAGKLGGLVSIMVVTISFRPVLMPAQQTRSSTTCPTLCPIIPIKATHFLAWLCADRSAILGKKFVLGSSYPVNGLVLFPIANHFSISVLSSHVCPSAVMTGLPHNLHRQRWCSCWRRRRPQSSGGSSCQRCS
jgi:hypothetical protein